MKTFLFQGDSITDFYRHRDDDDGRYSAGYPRMVAACLGYENPGEIHFMNMGVSGDKIVDVYARIKCDIINLKPDYMSILIGVNDVWHELNEHDGVDNDKYYRVYCALIEEVKAALPDIKIMILEPFVLNGCSTEKYYDEFRAEVEKRAESAKKVAEKYGLTFVPLQKKFDEACEKAPSSFWLEDGVHPAAPGHELIARALCEAFYTIK